MQAVPFHLINQLRYVFMFFNTVYYIEFSGIASGSKSIKRYPGGDIIFVHTRVISFFEKHFTSSLRSVVRYFFNTPSEISYLRAAM